MMKPMCIAITIVDFNEDDVRIFHRAMRKHERECMALAYESGRWLEAIHQSTLDASAGKKNARQKAADSVHDAITKGLYAYEEVAKRRSDGVPRVFKRDEWTKGSLVPASIFALEYGDAVIMADVLMDKILEREVTQKRASADVCNLYHALVNGGMRNKKAAARVSEVVIEGIRAYSQTIKEFAGSMEAGNER